MCLPSKTQKVEEQDIKAIRLNVNKSSKNGR